MRTDASPATADPVALTEPKNIPAGAPESVDQNLEPSDGMTFPEEIPVESVPKVPNQVA